MDRNKNIIIMIPEKLVNMIKSNDIELKNLAAVIICKNYTLDQVKEAFGIKELDGGPLQGCAYKYSLIWRTHDHVRRGKEYYATSPDGYFIWTDNREVYLTVGQTFLTVRILNSTAIKI